jgi:hypothetical protein
MLPEDEPAEEVDVKVPVAEPLIQVKVVELSLIVPDTDAAAPLQPLALKGALTAILLVGADVVIPGVIVAVDEAVEQDTAVVSGLSA